MENIFSEENDEIERVKGRKYSSSVVYFLPPVPHISLPSESRDTLANIFVGKVQHECIPQAVLGVDIICQAKSGMGKTAEAPFPPPVPALFNPLSKPFQTFVPTPVQAPFKASVSAHFPALMPAVFPAPVQSPPLSEALSKFLSQPLSLSQCLCLCSQCLCLACFNFKICAWGAK